LVSNNDLKYLTREEAEQIIEHFEEIPQTYDRLVFWTGIPRDWVQQWADEHGMLTLTSAMGPLMDRKDPRCLRRFKELEEWSKYIKGASRIFARYACKRGIVRVLTLPPSWADFIRPESTYRNIEEPVLKGISDCCCAIQINTVHLLTTLEELEYQTWPENHIPEKLRCRGAGSSNFRLPRWTRKAVKAATKSLRSNCVGSTVFSTSKPANVNVVLETSVRTTSGPQSMEQPNGGKQSRDSTNTQGHSRLQSQQPQCKKWLQTQQTTSKKKQPQTQQTTSKKKQPQTQQTTSKKKQPQTQQTSSKKEQPQTQQTSSKKEQPQTQQTSSKKEQPQTQQTSSKEEQPQTQQTSSKEEQPQTQQTSSKEEQPQTQQMSSKKKQLQTQQTLSKKKQPQTQQTSSKQQQQPQKQQNKKQPQIQKPQSNNPQPQKSKQPQQSQQPQSSRKLIIKAGA
jgi:DNA segregation ATPase FtsK/SpoIIIE-like protein